MFLAFRQKKPYDKQKIVFVLNSIRMWLKLYLILTIIWGSTAHDQKMLSKKAYIHFLLIYSNNDQQSFWTQVS